MFNPRFGKMLEKDGKAPIGPHIPSICGDSSYELDLGP